MRALKTQYYGMISEVDSQLGRVVRALEERGEWEDTLVSSPPTTESSWATMG